MLFTERQLTGRMDYIVWHQDLVTSAPVSDLEIFRVPDEGLFLAAAALDRRDPGRKQQSTLFKWNSDHFTVYQSLYTLGAYCWEHFVIGSRVSQSVNMRYAFGIRLSRSIVWKRLDLIAPSFQCIATNWRYEILTKSITSHMGES